MIPQAFLSRVDKYNFPQRNVIHEQAVAVVTGGIAEMSFVSQDEERVVRPRRGFAKLALKVRCCRDLLVA